MKQFSKLTYNTEIEPIPNYSLKDTLLQNSLHSKKAQYSSRLFNDTSSNNFNLINSRGKSYEMINRNHDYINTEIPIKKQIGSSIPNSNINRSSNPKISPIYNTTSLDFKKYNTHVTFDNSVNKSPAYTEYSKITREKDEKIIKSSKLITNFLPEKAKDKLNKKTLVLDLDETLVHSAFNQFYMKSDIILNIELDRKKSVVHVLKRPGVDEFLQKMSRHYEVVIFTASVSAYANPLINQLDTKRNVSHRLFREHCTFLNGNFVKDMRKLGRNLKDVIILDVSNVILNVFTLE
jgi:Dullard-like phosphatase family protein